MDVLLWSIVACTVAGVLAEAVRRAPFGVAVFVFAIVPLLLLPLWMVLGLEITVFRVVKTFSVAPAGLLIAAIKYGRIFSTRSLGRVAWLVMAINILEAVLTEASGGLVWNPLAGALLLLALAAPSQVRPARDSTGPWTEWTLGWDWVFAYTLWNWVFQYSSAPPGETPGIWGALAFVHLGVPLLLTRGRAERWIEGRVSALFFSMIWIDTVPASPPFIVLTPWYLPSVAAVLQVLSLLVAAAVVLRHVMRLRNPPPSLASTLGGARPRPARGV